MRAGGCRRPRPSARLRPCRRPASPAISRRASLARSSSSARSRRQSRCPSPAPATGGPRPVGLRPPIAMLGIARRGRGAAVEATRAPAPSGSVSAPNHSPRRCLAQSSVAVAIGERRAPASARRCRAPSRSKARSARSAPARPQPAAGAAAAPAAMSSPPDAEQPGEEGAGEERVADRPEQQPRRGDAAAPNRTSGKPDPARRRAADRE